MLSRHRRSNLLSENSENAFVNRAHGVPLNEARDGFDGKRKLSENPAVFVSPFCECISRKERFTCFSRIVLWAIDKPEMLFRSAFQWRCQ
jgi:hypothetical protein